jgi:hypothetical protein
MPARKTLSLVSLISSIVFVITATSSFAQDVLTYHNNMARTGLNNKETILTQANVNSGTFGKLFTITVDGRVDAQPLYLSQVSIPQHGKQNLLIVATEHDSLYAFNADTGAQYWHIRTLKAGEGPSDDRGCSQVSPEIGITSTPVINRPAGTNGIIYVVSMSKDSSSGYHQRLHAIDPTNGKEVNGGPVDITGKYPGKGDNSSGGNVIFDPAQYKERSGLLFTNGTVYLAWASHCDFRPYTGWIMAYNGTTLTQTSILNVTPNGNEGAIWGAGNGLASDGLGSIFFLDANGFFDTSFNATGFPKNGDYGNGFVKLSTTGGLKVADYWEMYNQKQENDSDTDLGSGGALLFPAMTDSAGKTRHLAVGAGKDQNLYIIDRDSMGKFNAASNKIYQQLSGGLPGGIFSSPAYFNNKLYYGPVDNSIFAFQFTKARLQTAPVAKTVPTFGYPGATPSISSNGITNGIVWATENSSPATLHAFSAATLVELYNSDQAGTRDQFGNGNKYITPTIANGKVYVGTTTGVGVFGLLPASAAKATPVSPSTTRVGD